MFCNAEERRSGVFLGVLTQSSRRLLERGGAEKRSFLGLTQEAENIFIPLLLRVSNNKNPPLLCSSAFQTK